MDSAGWFDRNVSADCLLDRVLGGEITLAAGEAAEPFIDADGAQDAAATGVRNG